MIKSFLKKRKKKENNKEGKLWLPCFVSFSASLFNEKNKNTKQNKNDRRRIKKRVGEKRKSAVPVQNPSLQGDLLCQIVYAPLDLERSLHDEKVGESEIPPPPPYSDSRELSLLAKPIYTPDLDEEMGKRKGRNRKIQRKKGSLLKVPGSVKSQSCSEGPFDLHVHIDVNDWLSQSSSKVICLFLLISVM